MLISCKPPQRVRLLAHAADALAALLEAAPKLPATFIASCACAMYISAARSLLALDATKNKEALKCVCHTCTLSQYAYVLFMSTS
jgi:hypothetical protein